MQNLTPELSKEDVEKDYVEKSEKVLENIIAHKEPIDMREKDLMELNKRIETLDERLQDLKAHSSSTRKKVDDINKENKNLR